MSDPVEGKLRNIALVGHGGAGTTSLAEALLHYTKATARPGNVDAGQSNLDYDAEEINRKFTLNLSLAPITYNGVKINLIDTPGYADFIGDAIAAMRAVELALFVVDAVSGPQVTTDRLWAAANEMNLPRAIFMNRMDKEHADYSAAFATLRARYGKAVVPVQIPIGSEENFKGIVDIVNQQAFYYDNPTTPAAIPEELLDKATHAREALIDSTADADEALMEKYLEGEEITNEELDRLLDKAIRTGALVPVFCGSAQTGAGIDDLLRAMVTYFPYAHKGPAFKDTDGVVFDAQAEKGFTGFVFKTLSDPYIGRLSFVKILSGTLADGDEFIDSRTGKKERAPHIVTMLGKESKPLGKAEAGDIVVLPKLSDVLTNDTLSTSGKIKLAPIPFPEPLYPVAIVAKTKADEDKLGTALKVLVDENPTIQLERNEETHQTILKTYGDTAVDVILSRLRDRYHVETELDPLRIPYRETITKTARADYRHKKQSGGAGQFGEVHLIVEPYVEGMPTPEIYKFNGQEFKISVRDTQTVDLDWGGKLVFINSIVGGSIDTRFLPAILKGIMGRMEQGPLTGSYARDVRIIVYDGKMHPVDSNEISFMLAGRNAFSTAFKNAGPKILEPVYDVEVSVPADYLGDVMSDMQGRRAIIMGMDSEAGFEKLKAKVPLKEMSSYSTSLSSITGGRGSFTMKFSAYELVPTDVQEKLLKEYEASQEED